MGASGYGCVRGRAQATRFLRLRRSVGRRPAFLGRIACPPPTTTAAHSRHPRSTSTLLTETGQRLHRILVLRFLREISPQETFQHAIKPRNAVAKGSPRALAATKVRPAAPTPQSQPGLRISVRCRLKKSAPCGAKTQVTFHASHTVY